MPTAGSATSGGFTPWFYPLGPSEEEYRLVCHFEQLVGLSGNGYEMEQILRCRIWLGVARSIDHVFEERALISASVLIEHSLKSYDSFL